MRKVRLRLTLAALVAALGLLAAVPADPVRAADKETTHTDKEIAARNKAAANVNDVGTAEALIEYGKSKKNPIAVLTAVEMLATVGEGKQVKPDSDDAKSVEGGKVQDPGNFYDNLRALLKEAKAMETGKSEAATALAKEAEEKIDASESAAKALKANSRGTAAGYTCTEVQINPGQTVSVTRTFMSGTACTATATKVVNVGVPLSVKVVGPNNTVYATGTSTVNWRVPKGADTKYTIQVTNNHSAYVIVKITTN